MAKSNDFVVIDERTTMQDLRRAHKQLSEATRSLKAQLEAKRGMLDRVKVLAGRLGLAL